MKRFLIPVVAAVIVAANVQGASVLLDETKLTPENRDQLGAPPDPGGCWELWPGSLNGHVWSSSCKDSKKNAVGRASVLVSNSLALNKIDVFVVGSASGLPASCRDLGTAQYYAAYVWICPHHAQTSVRATTTLAHGRSSFSYRNPPGGGVASVLPNLPSQQSGYLINTGSKVDSSLLSRTVSVTATDERAASSAWTTRIFQNGNPVFDHNGSGEGTMDLTPVTDTLLGSGVVEFFDIEIGNQSDAEIQLEGSGFTPHKAYQVYDPVLVEVLQVQ